MIILFKPHADVHQVADTTARVQALGYEPRVTRGVEHTIIAAIGDATAHDSLQRLVRLSWVESVTPVQKRSKLASREFHANDSVIEIAGTQFGGGQLGTIAGPCSAQRSGTSNRARCVAAGSARGSLRSLATRATGAPLQSPSPYPAMSSC